jgi:hypothetical protein
MSALHTRNSLDLTGEGIGDLSCHQDRYWKTSKERSCKHLGRAMMKGEGGKVGGERLGLKGRNGEGFPLIRSLFPII